MVQNKIETHLEELLKMLVYIKDRTLLKFPIMCMFIVNMKQLFWSIYNHDNKKLLFYFKRYDIMMLPKDS